MFKYFWTRIKKKAIDLYSKISTVRPEAVPGHKASNSPLTPYDYAKLEHGVKEIPGAKHNPRILEFHSSTSGFRDDETPWCSSFVNWTFKKAGFDHLRSKRANARSWLEFGVPTKIPREGDVVIFWRGSKDSWQGHVGFYVKETSSKILVLGGNQLNMVSYQWYSKARLLGYRTFNFET